jgi:flagellar protein FlgJ
MIEKNKDLTTLILSITGVILLIWKFSEGIIMEILSKKNFKKTMLPISAQIEKEFGIKPIITITQSAHESNWGRSKLTEIANNLFGFTGESWERQGLPVIRMETTEYVNGKKVIVKRPFRQYKSWYNSCQDWAKIISTLSRYKKAYEYAKKNNIEGFAIAVKEGGYATDPKYDTKLIALSKVVKEIEV